MFTARLILTIGFLAAALGGYSQDSLLLRDYQFVRRSDAWLTSHNAAGLTRLATPGISEAELSLTKGNGGLTDYDGSANTLDFSARIASYTRLSRRTVVFGSMAYNNYSGKDMAGSAFISSDRKPFGLVEDSLTNTGTKHRDTYQLAGGVGIDVVKGLAVGLRFDYTAANYAKYKDLRHKNKLMDMTFTAGLLTPVAPWLSLGANYLYRRNTESVAFSLYGREDKVYKTLIDYGAFMGRVEQFGSTGFTDKSREMPLVDDYNGGGLQFSLQPAEGVTFYSAITYTYRKGYYGRKSPYTITYTNHHSNLLSYEARLSWQTPQTALHADLTLSSENLENEANTYRERQNDAGAYYYEYYDPVKTANKLWKDGRLLLTADLGIQGELPRWTLTAGLNWMHRQQTAYLYPYYRRQDLRQTEVAASATRNWPTAKGVWTLSLAAAYQKGSGQPCEDLTFAAPSSKQSAPASMEAWLMREYQYLVAPQYSIGGALKYAFVMPKTRLKTHVRLSLSHRKANNSYAYSNGSDHTQATIAIGCTF